jgi:hypothetical protein
MKWKKTMPVTVKRLHDKPLENSSRDLLIEELTFLKYKMEY